ncbi:hypothetical protein ACQR16_17285 [Bradyrhizobium oligotrophicum]|uniref:hypothetical protein n=1 Tax=Bradyrhizobium oligotrophicum TaxID=44255 RepID=UPI003EB9A51F
MAGDRRSTEFPPKKQSVHFASTLEELIRCALAQEASDFTLSRERIFDVARYFLRDMYRVESAEDGELSVTKFCAYLTYWIARLRPISVAYETAHPSYPVDKSLAEIVDVNEDVAIELGLMFLGTTGGGSAPFDDHVRCHCSQFTSQKCDGSSCVKDHVKFYFDFHNRFFETNLKYNMKTRLTSPHFYNSLYDHIIFCCCLPYLR